MVGVWRSTATKAIRLIVLVVALGNLGIPLWIPPLVGKAVGYGNYYGTAQPTPGALSREINDDLAGSAQE
jgi:hypothetical protein